MPVQCSWHCGPATFPCPNQGGWFQARWDEEDVHGRGRRFLPVGSSLPWPGPQIREPCLCLAALSPSQLFFSVHGFLSGVVMLFFSKCFLFVNRG